MLTRDDIIRIARAEVESRKLYWDEPVSVELITDHASRPYPRPKPYWSVFTNSDSLGGNIVIHVDAATGEILKFGWMER